MKTKFTQNIIFLLFLNVLIKPFWVFGIDRSIQNTVGSQDYGLYFSLFGFSLIFNIIADVGITNYSNRYIAQNQDSISMQIGRIIPVKILLSFIYAILTISIAFFIGYSNYQIILLIWLVVNQILISTAQYLRSNIAGLQLFNTNSILSVIDKLLLIVICSWLLWFSSFNYFKIEWLIYSQTFAYVMSMLISLFVVLKHAKHIQLSFSIEQTVRLLKKSFPYASFIFLMNVYTRIDGIMIERILQDGELQAGIYAQAFRIIDALYMVTVLFGSILLPMFAKLLKENVNIRTLLKNSFALLIVPFAGLVIAVFLYSQEIMQLLYIEHINKSSKVFVMLIIGFMGIAIGYIFGTLLTADGKLKLLNKVGISAVVINIVLNSFLIPKYGIEGAAFSSMITQILVGLWQIAASVNIFKLSISLTLISRYSLFSVLLIILSFISNILIEQWYISFVIIIAMSFPLAFATSILKLKIK